MEVSGPWEKALLGIWQLGKFGRRNLFHSSHDLNNPLESSLKHITTRDGIYIILTLLRQRQVEFDASLVYKVSSRTARTTQRNPVSKTKKQRKGWRDGSVVKSTDCSPRGPEFNFQQPHDGSQLSVMGSDAPL